jgi:hypothetical protein
MLQKRANAPHTSALASVLMRKYMPLCKYMTNLHMNQCCSSMCMVVLCLEPAHSGLSTRHTASVAWVWYQQYCVEPTTAHCTGFQSYSATPLQPAQGGEA